MCTLFCTQFFWIETNRFIWSTSHNNDRFAEEGRLLKVISKESSYCCSWVNKKWVLWKASPKSSDSQIFSALHGRHRARSNSSVSWRSKSKKTAYDTETGVFIETSSTHSPYSTTGEEKGAWPLMTNYSREYVAVSTQISVSRSDRQSILKSVLIWIRSTDMKIPSYRYLNIVR